MEAAAPAAEPAAEPNAQEEQPEFFNPLNGEILDAPWTTRIFAVSVNNLADAMPHHGLMEADIVFETLINNSVIRTLDVFSDVTKCTKVGPIRSDRIMWNDLGLRYDAVVTHASGSSQVLRDARDRNVSNINVDRWEVADFAGFRDQERSRHGYSIDATLFGIGPGMMEYAGQQGFATEFDQQKDYFLRFVDDATPADGVNAGEITVTISAPSWRKGGGIPKKDTTMIYDSELGKYVWHQYGKQMVDGNSEEGAPEAFKNVIILEADITYAGMYQQVRFDNGGTGWFATGGKAIPIMWISRDDHSAIQMTTLDGQPLYLSRGNTYIAITQFGSSINGIGE